MAQPQRSYACQAVEGSGAGTGQAICPISMHLGVRSATGRTCVSVLMHVSPHSLPGLLSVVQH